MMTTVETTVTISINPEYATLEELEENIRQQVHRAGKDLLSKAFGIIESKSLENRNLRRCKSRERYLLTGFGWTQISRSQVRNPAGDYFCPLDQILGLQPRQHASPWVLQHGISLATRLPYRQAAYLLSGFLDEDIDHRSLYRWVQKAGALIVVEEDELQQDVFEHGVVPPRDLQQREIVLTEVDGTFIRSQREAGKKFEVRLGILTTGKILESQTAKHRRYRLQERVRYGAVENAQNFGERLFLKGEALLGLSHAQHLLLVGDGADWIETLAGHDRWRATYQLDWWHLIHAFRRTFPEHPKLVHKLKQALYQGEGEKILPIVRLAKLNDLGQEERVDVLITYLETNQEGFYGARKLRPRLSAEAKRVCVEGSGAIEKHIDLIVCRRFKGQGMCWTRVGANRLLKLRIIELDRAA